MSRIYYTNDYFLGFIPEDGHTTYPKTPKIVHADIPEGYEIYDYREVYIPARTPGLTSSRGAGTNPDTMDVPIYYKRDPVGLRRAIVFCRQGKEHDQQEEEKRKNSQFPDPYKMRVHCLPDSSRVVEYESSDKERKK